MLSLRLCCLSVSGSKRRQSDAHIKHTTLRQTHQTPVSQGWADHAGIGDAEKAGQMMQGRVVLDLCGGTGSWSQPYVKAGYAVVNVTLPHYDVRSFTPPDQVYGILAAPPCTHFSLARTRAKTPRDFRGAMQIVEACMRIIWECRMRGSLKWWAMENPTGFLRQFMGRPAMTFKPCEYGDAWGKRTDLWGYFQLPRKLKVPVAIEPGQHRASRWHDLPGNRQERRSMTPQGFAQAFFKANQ